MWALATLVLPTAAVIAQDYRGRAQGNVTDPSHAPIVGAKVTLTNLNTGIESVKVTDIAGFYRCDYVQPGTYSLTVEAAGFNKHIQENITVLTAGDVTVNAQMSVGVISEAVTVSAVTKNMQT